jgi:hypothetical protein
VFKYFSFNVLVLITGCTEAKVKKIVIYGSERTSTITDLDKLQYFGENLSAFTNNIDDVLKIIITPSQVDEIINNEQGVEVQYSGIHKVYRANNKYPISFSKIYIPFSGKYSKFGVVYFFGDDEGYGGLPPYITYEGLNKLQKFVQHIEK